MATLSELEAELAKYEAARDKVLNCQEWSTSEMRISRPNLEGIEKKITSLRFAIARAKGQTTTYPLFSTRS